MIFKRKEGRIAFNSAQKDKVKGRDAGSLSERRKEGLDIRKSGDGERNWAA